MTGASLAVAAGTAELTDAVACHPLVWRGAAACSDPPAVAAFAVAAHADAFLAAADAAAVAVSRPCASVSWLSWNLLEQLPAPLQPAAAL